ncbi:glycosyltransferase family 4 protein [Leifsonia sp. 21MFCrub1.1]|uniref:glycosyltransferase family 4 protein n=1 Tax=Leifsonia sp. 21MFCrub1.1 TaxID=1798223 RepID=UPI00089282EF|nr:glycosyltransferase family 4 protein [Leifsonia sp. 21MFCrub1.1]SEB00691.1 Glycosyltransferase involved in cell wall bisynthesis [Leifsonia sp. 21MFCrub1.1]
MRRRVAVVSTWFPSAATPTQAPFNLEHAQAIADTSVVAVTHLQLGASGPIRSEEYGGFPVTRIPLSPRHPLRAIRGLRALQRNATDADVVQSMAFSTVLALILVRPWTRRPWVHAEHWNGVSRPRSVGALWTAFSWLRHALRFTDHLGGDTSELTEVMRRFAGRTPTEVIPCVVENPRPVPESRPEGIHLVAMGALVPRKNPLLAVDVVSALRATHPGVTMRWVGDGPLRAEVERRIAERGLEDAFTLVGNVEPTERFAEYEHASVYFLPSLQENFFTSAAEALSTGVPVVAGAVGGFTEFADAANSVIVPRDRMTVDAFVAAIEKAYETFADVAPETIALPIRRRFGFEALSAQFDRIYSQY